MPKKAVLMATLKMKNKEKKKSFLRVAEKTKWFWIPVVIFGFLFSWDFSLGEEHAKQSQKSMESEKSERSQRLPSGYVLGESLSLILVDPQKKNVSRPEERHPWIRLFENGKDQDERDLQPTLDFLKWARAMGKEKIRPKEDEAPGLILTFRGLELAPNPRKKGYTLKLFGEFNASEFDLTEDQVKNLFDGNLTEWEISNETSRSTGFTRYKIKTDLKIRMTLSDKTLKIHSLQGKGTISTSDLRSKETYHSDPVSIGNPKSLDSLWVGTPGALPSLPVIK